MPVKRRKRKSKTTPLTVEQSEVVAENRGLIGVATKRMTFKNLSTYDQDQEGAIALANAVKGFRPKEGVRFSTYAVKAIQNTLMRRDREYDMIRVPHYLRAEGGAEHRFYEHVKAVDGIVSIDAAADGDRGPADVEDDESEFGWRAMRAVDWAIRKLPPDERRVIREVVIRDVSPTRFGAMHGMSRSEVLKAKLRAFAKLRATLQKHV